MTGVRTVLSAMFLVLALAAAAPLSAQYVEMYRLDNRVKDLPEQDVLNTLATHLGVPVDTLKQEKVEYKSSVGELYTAHQFAKQTSSDFKSMMTELKSGKSWGELARDKKVDMDQFSKNARQLEDAIKKNQRASK
jgi:transcriptional regulator with XRE-family HTH domain